jgi:hypothetical protein
MRLCGVAAFVTARAAIVRISVARAAAVVHFGS